MYMYMGNKLCDKVSLYMYVGRRTIHYPYYECTFSVVLQITYRIKSISVPGVESYNNVNYMYMYTVHVRSHTCTHVHVIDDNKWYIYLHVHNKGHLSQSLPYPGGTTHIHVCTHVCISLHVYKIMHQSYTHVRIQMHKIQNPLTVFPSKPDK